MKPNEAPRLEGWIGASEIAEDLGISRQTVNQMFWNDEFDTLRRVGGESKKPILVVSEEEYERVKATRTFPRSGKTVQEAVESAS